MISSEVGKKYAAALFKTAKKNKLTDSVLENFRLILKLLEENLLFKNLLEAPQVREKEKKELLNNLFKGRISELLLSLLTLLVDKKRIQYLFDIFPEYERLVKEDKGIVVAEVTTAIPLDETMCQRLQEKLERKTRKKIEMQKKVDLDIIGGMLVVLGDKVIDRSIRYQLSELKERISGVRVH